MMMDRPFTIRTRVSSRGEASAHLKEPGDAVIVDRQGPRWLILKCPCGCGAELPVNLDRRSGPAWRLYMSRKGVSVYPSVWRDTDCKSHFIIWRNKILMLGPQYDDSWLDETDPAENELAQRVLDALTTHGQSAEEVSDQIPGSVPWDVLRCCQRLSRSGLVIEGHGQERGRFWRR
jgi:hypothetical protein